MRTISGYILVFFLIFAIARVIDVNSAMGFWGALYIVFIAASVFLQIPEMKDFSNFLQEFVGQSKITLRQGGDNLNMAKEDLSRKYYKTKNQ